MLPQELSNATYRLIGRLLASALGSFDIVRGVFLRRSVAMGEVSFGRSDIDLTIILNKPLTSREEVERLVTLNRCRQALRICAPILGECEVGTADELIRSYRADPYRASIDRRTAIPVFGEPLEIPRLPIKPADALNWVALWYGQYLPVAIRTGNGRNLRKFAIEMWNAARTATGDIDEPYATRREALRAWRQWAGESPTDDHTLEQVFMLCCQVVGEAHRRLLPPLTTVGETTTVLYADQRWIMIPENGPPPSRETLKRRSFVATPEILDLCVSHVDPMSHSALSPEALQIGIRKPGFEEHLDYCRRWACDPRMLRLAGFMRGRHSAAYSIGMFEAGREAARQLRDGKIPEGISRHRDDIRQHPPSIAGYYRSYYPQLYQCALEAWHDLDAVEAGGQSPAPAASDATDT